MITDAIWLKNGKKINFFTVFYIGFRCNHLLFGFLLLVLFPINTITDAKRTLRLIARNTCLRTTITAVNLLIFLIFLVVLADLTLARSVRIECLIAVNTEQLATITTADKPIILLAHLTALIALLRLVVLLVVFADLTLLTPPSYGLFREINYSAPSPFLTAV